MRTRTFILVAVALFAVLLGGFVYVALSGGDGERRIGALRQYTVGNWALEMGGVHVSYLKSVGGCGVQADLEVGAKADGVAGVNKHPGRLRYGPCRLQVPVNPATLEWFQRVLATGGGAARSMSLLQTDSTNVTNRLDLASAAVTEFSLPALDASGKDPLNFDVVVEPASIQKAKAGDLAPKLGVAAKATSVANFKLTIPGIDTTKVSKVGAWSFEAGTFSNLTVETAEVAAPSFESYLESFLNTKDPSAVDQAEKTGTLEFLAPDLKTVVFQIDFTGMGIIAGEFFGASESSADLIARREFSFYVENATLKFNK